MRKILWLLLLLPILSFAEPSTVVYDITNQRVLDGSTHSNEVSIASISKLMTVHTVLKHNQDLSEKLKVIGKRTSNTKLVKGMVLTRLDLINLALIGSDNLAAMTLAENFPGGYSVFIQKMNESATELNMHHSGFVEPTGLSPMNYSTVYDILALTNAASQYTIVQEAAKVKYITVETVSGKRKVKIVSNSTSSFFGRDGIVTIKTGFTTAAGFCITMLVNTNDKLYNIIILGAKSKQQRQYLVEKSLKAIINA